MGWLWFWSNNGSCEAAAGNPDVSVVLVVNNLAKGEPPGALKQLRRMADVV